MASRRKYGEDLTYDEWHRVALPELYGRIGHRQDQANRDHTEFCHHCKQPLAVIEQVLDVGQDINDKATTVTRNLAAGADVFAVLLAVRIERPPEIQAEIDGLWQRLLEIYRAYLPVSFKAKQLWPVRTRLHDFTPGEWAEQILILHRNHHLDCAKAHTNGELPVHVRRLWVAKSRSGLWVPANDQLSLWHPDTVAQDGAVA